MGFPRVIDLANDYEGNGEYWTSFFHKTGSPILTGAGVWADLSMAAGTPKYNAYVGTQNEGTPMLGVGNNGIYAGPGISASMTKHISSVNIQSASATLAPAHFVLCDYLYSYPLTDMDMTDIQVMDNSVATVPRYADGLGVRAMLVTTTPQTGVAQCVVTYTNSNGVTGRTSSIYTAISNTGLIQGAQAASGAANAQSPFIPLASGDKGIRVIESVQMLSSAGGFCAVVLVKPLLNIQLYERNTVSEIDYLMQRPSLPRVLDGAYLNFVFTSGVTAVSSVIRGSVDFDWN